MEINKKKVQQCFSRASSTYDLYADIQKTCAQQLVKLLRSYFSEFYPASILDIGTGTGYIPEMLLPLFPHSQYLLNDLSARMLAQASTKLGGLTNIHFIKGDMENIAFTSHSLIISNFSLQWASNLKILLQRLYKQCEVLVFSCLLEGTFVEWKQLFEQNNLPIPTYCYPTLQQMTNDLSTLNAKYCYIETQKYSLDFSQPLDFIRYLHHLGANATTNPLSFTHLKKLYSLSPHRPFRTAYNVGFALIGKI